MAKTAQLIKVFPPNPQTPRSRYIVVELYRVTPPLAGYDFVVVSASALPEIPPETYLFGADADGRIDTFDELTGSVRGFACTRTALELAHYTILPPAASADVVPAMPDVVLELDDRFAGAPDDAQDATWRRFAALEY